MGLGVDFYHDDDGVAERRNFEVLGADQSGERQFKRQEAKRRI
jgi:hypothetical protein